MARGWLPCQLTGSSFALAWVSAGRSIARLVLSLYAGALADRFEKRQMLIITRGATAANSPILALLVLVGSIGAWHLVASSLVSGTINSFLMPAQKAYLSQLVGRRALLNAMSLTSLGRGLVGVLGTSLAGFAIEWWGVQTVYLKSRLPPDQEFQQPSWDRALRHQGRFGTGTPPHDWHGKILKVTSTGR